MIIVVCWLEYSGWFLVISFVDCCVVACLVVIAYLIDLVTEW